MKPTIEDGWEHRTGVEAKAEWGPKDRSLGHEYWSLMYKGWRPVHTDTTYDPESLYRRPAAMVVNHFI